MSAGKLYSNIKNSKVNRSITRKLRSEYIRILKEAAESGILQNYRGTGIEYGNKKRILTERGGEISHDSPTVKKEKADPSVEEPAPSLSTRYVPGKPGLMAERIRGGESVYMDPYTKKIYDWREGFKDESGQEYPGGCVSLQSDLYTRSSICDPAKLKK